MENQNITPEVPGLRTSFKKEAVKITDKPEDVVFGQLSPEDIDRITAEEDAKIQAEVDSKVKASGGIGGSAEIDFDRRLTTKEKTAAEITQRMAARLATADKMVEKPISKEIESLEKTLLNFQTQRKNLSFFDFSAKKSLDQLIAATQSDLGKKKTERAAMIQNTVFENIKPLLKTITDQIKEKEAELASLSAWQLWTIPRQMNLRSEIATLRKRQIREALVSQNLLEKNK